MKYNRNANKMSSETECQMVKIELRLLYNAARVQPFKHTHTHIQIVYEDKRMIKCMNEPNKLLKAILTNAI